MSLFDFLFKKTSDAQNIERLTSDAFTKAIQKSNIQLIDVRTPDEFRSGHYKNAKNLNFFDGASFQKGIAALNKEAAVYVYCRSGNRSRSAASLLAKKGFVKIYDLKGGYVG